jgi:hypothetical protein
MEFAQHMWAHLNSRTLHDLSNCVVLPVISLLCVFNLSGFLDSHTLTATFALYIALDFLYILTFDHSVSRKARPWVLLHHVVTLALQFHGLRERADSHFTSWHGLVEMNTTFIILRKHFPSSNFLCWVCSASSYVRAIYVPAIAYTICSKAHISTLFSGSLLVYLPHGFLVLFNFMWFYRHEIEYNRKNFQQLTDGNRNKSTEYAAENDFQKREMETHDKFNVFFLSCFCTLCVADLYHCIPENLTTLVLTSYIVFDTFLICATPHIIPNLLSFIILHHIITALLLLRPLLWTEHVHFTSLAGLIELDTLTLLLRRLSIRGSKIHTCLSVCYFCTNVILRGYFEFHLCFRFWGEMKETSTLEALHVMVCQLFFLLFSWVLVYLNMSKWANEYMKKWQ